MLSLSACKTSEETAEDYYQSGIALLAQGDEDRALIEFRNVFKYNGMHQQARKTYADILYKRGQTKEAYSQYLRLIEQYPNTVEVRQILAEIAFDIGNWDEVERHGGEAVRLAPQDPRSQAISLAIEYRKAVIDRDTAKQAELAERGLKLIETQPSNLMVRRIVVDQEMSSSDPARALPQIEAALKIAPKNGQFHAMKLKLLGQIGDMKGIGAELKVMVGLYPDNVELKQSLIRWFMAQKDIDGAEGFLRSEAGDIRGPSDGHVALVQFLDRTRGRAVARAELGKLIEANKGTPNDDLYSSFLATMDFEDGHKTEAVAALEAIVAKAEASDQTRKMMSLLARMYEATGAHDKAVALISQVLAADATNVDALMMRATWAIAADKPGDAIVDLRTAQSQAPRDPRIMTLLASAFERDGSTDLAGEQLSKAVEASNRAPEESLRYAAFLRKQNRISVAETVLTDARRVSPTHPAVLNALAQVLLVEQKWPQVQEIIDTFKQINTPETLQAAQQLQAAILFGQNRGEDGLSLLESQAADNMGDLRSTVVVITTQLRAGKVDEARNFLDAALTKTPDAPVLRLLKANIDAMQGQNEAAEAGYRALIAQNPKADLPVRLLYGLLMQAGHVDAAQAALDAGLQNMPENSALLSIKAAALETAGDFEGAIGIYEKLYALDSANVVVANNLASMITSHRDDAASLERADVIARRLRGTEEPAFQDTYGWIQYRRGNLEEALKYLEPAAKGLPKDPMAQFHLGMLYADMGRSEAAAKQFQLTLDLGQGRDMPQLEEARKRLAAPTAPTPKTAP